ncbi:MAG: cyclic nucleotide-binding domain-containing protein [wastewater metagenome]|nr:cyclic nucleotide-binding domain-containing protein [Candidatus Loosdrechtia aerotolerans]
MADYSHKKTFKKGETIVKEGLESYNVYIITSGEAEVRKSYLGEEVCVNILKKGAVFGLPALITKSTRRASVRALTDLEVGVIYHDDFIRLMEELPADVKNVIHTMVEELAGAYELCAELTIYTKMQYTMLCQETEQILYCRVKRWRSGFRLRFVFPVSLPISSAFSSVGSRTGAVLKSPFPASISPFSGPAASWTSLSSFTVLKVLLGCPTTYKASFPASLFPYRVTYSIQQKLSFLPSLDHKPASIIRSAISLA